MSVASTVEQFLANFHDERPGITSAAFGALVVHGRSGRFASSYDSLAATVPSSAGSVLDLACGDGHLLALLGKAAGPARRLVGIDISAGELAKARERLGSSAELLQGRAQCLPLADGSVHQVLCHMALMLMDDLDAVLDEVRRVLVPGGRFAFTVGARGPHPPAFEAYLRRLRALIAVEPARFIRFGDARLATEAGLHQALAGRFEGISVEALSLQRRCTPAQAWDWVDGMYDLRLVEADARERFKQAHLAELHSLCDADGLLQMADTLHQVGATAR